ncbi:MAG: alpha/beta hydrolase [Clostridiaceae bacterium]|nr:alpha/beta hydrolase [Clostridiaceae bacterium]
MNPLMRFFLKLVSRLKIDMKKNYKKVRNLQQALTPDVSYRYTIFDHKIYSFEEKHNIPIRVFLPNTPRKPGALLFFHGGGWVIGDIETYTPTCARMADLTGQIVYSVDYRLAPEHPFPAGLNDCYDACKYLMQHHKKFDSAMAGEFTLIGDSAGANLAAVVSLRLRDGGKEMVDKQILIYPATYWDHNEESSPFDSVRTNGKDYGLTSKRVQEYMELYVPDPENRKNPEVAPLMANDFSQQPKTLVISTEHDPLRDEGEAYAYALAKANNEVYLRRILGAPHGFFTFPDVTGAIEESYKIINRFLYDLTYKSNQKLGGSNNGPKSETQLNFKRKAKSKTETGFRPKSKIASEATTKADSKLAMFLNLFRKKTENKSRVLSMAEKEKLGEFIALMRGNNE